MNNIQRLQYCNFFALYAGTFILMSSGLLFGDILNLFGILSGQEAVEYYGEIHNSHINKIIHIIGIPIATYYFFLFVPEILFMNKQNAQIFMTFIYYTLCIHYCKINLHIGICVFLSYLFIYHKAMKDYGTYPKYHTVIYYFSLMGLIEFIGHTLFEQEQSRFGGVLNAILYSHYFNTQKLIEYIKY